MNSPTFTYSDKDELLLQQGRETLSEYEGLLMRRLKQAGHDNVTMRSLFISDPMRQRLVDNLITLNSVLTPIKITFELNPL